MGNRLITLEGTSIDVSGAWLNSYVGAFSKVPTTMQIFGTNGATISTWDGRKATVQAALHPTDLNVLVIGGPANNFGNAPTQATELAAYMQYLTDMKNYATSSGKKLRIVGCSLLPRSIAGNGPTVNAYRATFATALNGQLGLLLDAVVNYQIDAILGPNAAGDDTTLFGDGLHPTSLGQGHMARVCSPILDTFINVTTGVRRFRVA